MALDIGHLATAVCSPARDIHITPSIDKTSLISTVKFAEAGYITIFKRSKHPKFLVDFGHNKRKQENPDAFAKKLKEYAPEGAFKPFP